MYVYIRMWTYAPYRSTYMSAYSTFLFVLDTLLQEKEIEYSLELQIS